MNKFVLLILLVLTNFACGKEEKKPKQLTTQEKLEALKEKQSVYLSLLPSVQGVGGFIQSEACDSLLFTSLLASVNVPGISLQQAEASPGRWLRRPASLPECYSNGLSRSTISRDQLLGVLWWAFRTKQVQVVKDLWDYGESRDWFMGQDSAGGTHTLFTPLVPLIARIRYRLTGFDHPARFLPLASEFDQNKVGFEAHLQVLQVVLDSKVKGNISASGSYRLEEQAARQPNNPLFQWAVGNYEGAADSLLNESWWPADRLPSKRDRKEPWLLERDFGPDWEPADSDQQLSGGDFLFVVSLVLASSGQ